MERIFRNATIELAKKHAFARSLINTGRMAVANPYSRSPITSPELAQSHSVQNVGFKWADGSGGQLNQLLQWAGSLPLLLLWADTPPPAALLQAARSMAKNGQLRVVAVSRSGAVKHAWREQITDREARLAQACGADENTAWALIRPDSYLAARGQSTAALRKTLLALQGAKA
jgi:3-(3-hydroxy-phenyl)propionate hydroxylase